MRRVLGALALALAGAAASAGAWLVHHASESPPLDLDAVTRAAKASCAPLEVEGARTDGRTYFTFTCQKELDAGFCRPTRGGKVAPAPVPP